MNVDSEDVEKRRPRAPLVGMQIGAAVVVENSVEFPKKLKVEKPYDPVISLLGI